MNKSKIKRMKVTLSQELLDAENFFINEVENNTNYYLKKYNNLPSSCNGSYISSDLFKETFDIYTKNIESRKKYNQVIHNSCAVLAETQYNKVIKEKKYNKVIFLTGIPGSGKSYLFQSLTLINAIDENTIIYEGDITNKEFKDKINLAKNNNKELYMIVVNPTIELAFENVVNRLCEIGRGASAWTMARIMSNIPKTLKELKQNYDITISIYNKKTNYDVNYTTYNKDTSILLEHGTKEEIYNKILSLRETLSEKLKEDFIIIDTLNHDKYDEVTHERKK